MPFVAAIFEGSTPQSGVGRDDTAMRGVAIFFVGSRSITQGTGEAIMSFDISPERGDA